MSRVRPPSPAVLTRPRRTVFFAYSRQRSDFIVPPEHPRSRRSLALGVDRRELRLVLRRRWDDPPASPKDHPTADLLAIVGTVVGPSAALSSSWYHRVVT